MHSEEKARAVPPAFTSTPQPGSEAERRERERLARFHAAKADTQSQDEHDRAASQAQLRAKLEEADRANFARMASDRAARSARNRVTPAPWPRL